MEGHNGNYGKNSKLHFIVSTGKHMLYKTALLSPKTALLSPKIFFFLSNDLIYYKRQQFVHKMSQAQGSST